jgi:hypothetical protein
VRGSITIIHHITKKFASKPIARPAAKIIQFMPGKWSRPIQSNTFGMMPEVPAAVTPKAKIKATSKPIRPSKSLIFLTTKLPPPSLASSPHMAEIPMRRLFIQPSPDHKVVRPATPNMAPRWSIAVTNIWLMVSPKSPSTAPVMASWTCCIKSSRLASTVATTATISMKSGKIAKTE